VLAKTQARDWMTLEPENTLYLELAAERVVIELAPDFAPRARPQREGTCS